MKKTVIKLFTLFVACTLSFSLLAQDNTTTIVFDKTVHDFGSIYEKGGRVSYMFYYTNTGTEPLLLYSASPSCGCTTPEFGREPVAPGQRGWIKAIYDPLNRPGRFDKTISVSSSGKPSVVVLHIKGVVERTKIAIEDSHPALIGNALRLKSNVIKYSKVTVGNMSSQAVDVVNVGTEAVTVTFDKLPAMIKATVEPAKIEPGKTSKLIVTVDASAATKKEEGLYQTTIIPSVNGKALSEGITVTAVVEPDFSKLTAEQLDAAPVVDEIKDLNYLFGSVKKGTGITFEREIKNTGKSNLTLKTFSTNPLAKVSVSHSTVKPGQSAKVKVAMPTAKIEVGDVSFSIVVLTNAPKQPTIEYQASGKVEE